MKRSFVVLVIVGVTGILTAFFITGRIPLSQTGAIQLRMAPEIEAIISDFYAHLNNQDYTYIYNNLIAKENVIWNEQMERIFDYDSFEKFANRMYQKLGPVQEHTIIGNVGNASEGGG